MTKPVSFPWWLRLVMLPCVGAIVLLMSAVVLSVTLVIATFCDALHWAKTGELRGSVPWHTFGLWLAHWDDGKETR